MKNNDKPVTQKQLQEILDKTLKKYTTMVLQPTIMNTLHDFWEHVLEPKFNAIDKRFDSLEKNLTAKIEQVEDKVNQVQVKVHQNSRDIQSLSSEISNTPTRKEFETLRTKINPSLNA